MLMYIRGTTDYGIWYRSVENGALIGYSDSDIELLLAIQIVIGVDLWTITKAHLVTLFHLV